MDIFTTDSLRAAAETESGGKQTVLYTAKGQPSYMNVIPAFNCEDLGAGFGTGRHPAFIVNGVEKSEIFVATYQAVIRSGEALSLPGENPATGMNLDSARQSCLNAGPGWHLMTNWEWAGIALWSHANGHDVRGNTDYGKSHSNPEEKGTPAGGTSKILTGSGPDSWRHDGTPFGIADLVGNVWEWVDGLKLASGQIIMPTDNDFNLIEAQWPETGVCIDLAGGRPSISSGITSRGWNGRYFCDVAASGGFDVPTAIKQALLCPGAAPGLPGYFWADNQEGFEALPFRGGDWGDESDAGLAALHLDCGRSVADSNLGFRPAFIE